jgi:release factor glutamine methyltransferase
VTTIRQLLVDVERRFQQAGIESARTDAELLLAHILGITRSQLLIAPAIAEDQLHAYELVVRRRVLREPLQYITGTAPFRRLELEVGPGVLVPRPETELMIDIVKRFAVPGIALDLGAGSGCISLSLATELAGFEVYAVENSMDALNYLNKNITRYQQQVQPGSSVTALGIDLVELPKVKPELIGKVQVILANPPYVPVGSAVSAEVQYFEPAAAVFSESNGYAVIDKVIELAVNMLAPGGLIVIEHHELQGLAGETGGVIGKLRTTGKFFEINGVDDLTNRPRFSYGIRDTAS